MKDLSIGRKLTVAFGIMGCMMVLVLALAFINMKRADSMCEKVINYNVAKIEKANAVIKAIDQIAYGVAITIMSRDQGVVEEHKTLIAEKRREHVAVLEDLKKMERSEKGGELLAEIEAMGSKGKEANNRVMEIFKTGDRDGALDAYAKTARPYIYGAIETLEKLVVLQHNQMDSAYRTALEASAFYRLLLVVSGLFVLGFGAMTFILLDRGITVPLARGIDIADRLSRGELDIEVVVDRKDETGRLLGSMKNMAATWRGVVAQISNMAADLSAAATQLKSAADQMSRGASIQAERASMAATSSEEMSQTVLDVAKHAGNVSRSAEDTAETARSGEGVVMKAVAEVKEIASTVNESSQFVHSLGERSKKIGEIVGVINDIADQTNLLALNAAIEAARAGEQGRGFAVVADEVRKLAERTAHATSEIDTMIKSVQHEVARAVDKMGEATGKVDLGVKLSEEAGLALDTIVTSVDGLQGFMHQIASATEEMSSTSEEISKEIEQIATISRETSANSEQTAQASAEIAILSANLQNIVKGYRF